MGSTLQGIWVTVKVAFFQRFLGTARQLEAAGKPPGAAVIRHAEAEEDKKAARSSNGELWGSTRKLEGSVRQLVRARGTLGLIEMLRRIDETFQSA